jgi:dephospho-CoA kinase
MSIIEAVWRRIGVRYPRGVKRVLLTGMSGVGKSTVIGELAARGYKTVDADADEWSEAVDVAGEPDLIWREDRIQGLLSTEDAEVLFISGCATNQVRFYAQFDHIVLLSAPAQLIVERLATRTNNPYGKKPDEVARTLRLQQTVDPLLRRSASLEVDTTAPLDRVVATILDLVR